MNRGFNLALALVVSLTIPLSGCAPGNDDPAESAVYASEAITQGGINGVMLQGFYWNVPMTTPAGSWWKNLQSKAGELASAGFSAVWIPPPYKGENQYDVGYGVYDRYDLGEFNQKGTVATRYGTLGELQSAITALHGGGIQVYGDLVMNHFTFADDQETFNVGGNSYTLWTSFRYPGRGDTYSNFKWHSYNFNGAQQGPNGSWIQWHGWDFDPYANGDAYDNLMGDEVRYSDEPTAAETIKWGHWITDKLGLDGYRLDAAKHISTPFVNRFLDEVKGSRFAVSEAWFRNLDALKDYAVRTGGRTSLFDVPLHYAFVDMSNGNGGYDMRGLKFAGFTEANGPLSVSFVDNHDTDQQGGALASPVVNMKMLAYAYILMRDKGYPCVFYKDYYEYNLGAQIKRLIQIRKENAYGSSYEYNETDQDVYIYSRAGDATHKGVLLLLNDGGNGTSRGVTTPFKNATLVDRTGNSSATVTTGNTGYGVFPVGARSYSAWVPR